MTSTTRLGFLFPALLVCVFACTEAETDSAEANAENLAAQEVQPAASAAALPDQTIAAETEPVLLAVTGVAPDDVLNIRVEPDANAAIAGTLAPDATGIQVTAQGTGTLDWIHIAHDGVEGWVNARFLSFENAGQTLPIRLTCSGTEPFWGVELSYSRADVTLVFSDTAFTTGFAPPASPEGRTDQWLFAELNDPADFLLIEPAACSDGMSDNVYPYALAARLDGNVLAGCCR